MATGEAPSRTRRGPLGVLRAALGGLDATFTRGFALGTGLLLWPAAYALAIGLGLWGFTHAPLIPLLATNKLGDPERLDALRYCAGAGGAIALVYAIAITIGRLRHGRFNPLRAAGEVQRALFITLAFPFVVALKQPGIEKTELIWTVLLATAATVLVGVGVYRFARWEPLRLSPRLERLAGVVALLFVLGLWAFYGYALSDLSLTNHHALNTRTTDLGYYDNIFYQSAHGRPLGCTFIKGENHLSAHFDPILVLLSPLYLLHQGSELLLVLQSVWLGAGVVPVYLLARHKLGGHVPGLVLALSYTLYPALHGTNLYEFHSLTLIVPLVLWALYFFERGSYIGYAVFFVLALACREDVALLMCFVGAYGVFSGERRKVRMGWATIVLSAAYFVLVKRYVMTSADLFNTGHKDAYSFSYYFKDIIPRADQGGTAFIVNVLTNPIYALKVAFDDHKKILFLFLLFLPLAALPLFARRARLMLVYGILFCLLASREAVFTIHFQYAAVLFSVAFAAVPVALAQLRGDARVAALGLAPRRLERGLLAAMVAASLLVSWKFGALVKNDNFRAGFMGLTRELTEAQETQWAWVKEMLPQIPPGASVMTTNRLGAHVSNRKLVWFYRQGTPHDYVFVDEAELKAAIKKWHEKRKGDGELEELGRHRTLALFRVVTQGNEQSDPDSEFVPEGPEEVEPDKPPAREPPAPRRR